MILFLNWFYLKVSFAFYNRNIGCKNKLLRTLVCSAGIHRFSFAELPLVGCKCVVFGGQNKFSRKHALSTEHQSNQSVFCNYFNLLYIVSMCRVAVFYTCIQLLNMFKFISIIYNGLE